MHEEKLKFFILDRVTEESFFEEVRFEERLNQVKQSAM